MGVLSASMLEWKYTDKVLIFHSMTNSEVPQKLLSQDILSMSNTYSEIHTYTICKKKKVSLRNPTIFGVFFFRFCRHLLD
jgi:hypothetical protein